MELCSSRSYINISIFTTVPSPSTVRDPLWRPATDRLLLVIVIDRCRRSLLSCTAANMIVEKRHLEGCTLLQVEGVIRVGESAAFFAQTLERVLGEGEGHVVVDLSRIDEMDSTGIGELVGYLGKFKDRRRKLILVNPSDRIRRLLEVARLSALFPTYETVEAALAREV